MTEVLKFERHEKIATLTLHRPDRLNALSEALRGALGDALSECQADDNVGAIIITGAGRGFCAGADLTSGNEQQAPTQDSMLDNLGWMGRQAKSIYQLDKPVLCAVNGVAAGAGMSMAAACDMRIGCEHSRFKSVFIERNLSPDSGLSYFLPRIVGASRAADIIYTSRPIDAEEAYRMGLLDRLVPADKLLDTASEIAGQMLQWPPLALRMSKRVLHHNIEVELDHALEYELSGLTVTARAKNDARESTLAFTEKRKPTYTGT